MLILFAVGLLLQELALLEYTLLSFPPSVVAAAAVLLAQSYDNVFTTASELERVSGYSSQVLGVLLCLPCSSYFADTCTDMHFVHVVVFLS